MTRLQAYENTRHVLQEVKRFHIELSQMYERLADRTCCERTRMLLTYMQRREQKLAAALAFYEDVAPDAALDAWFQIPFPENLDDFLRLVSTDVAMDVMQAQQLISRADAFLIALLEHVASKVNAAEVKALFDDLLDIERQEEKALSKAINSLREF